MARKEQVATEPLPKGTNKASVVVSFPDGSRWLMELTPLQPTAQTQLPTLTQAANLAVIQTDGSAAVKTTAIDSPPATNRNGLEPIHGATTDEQNDVTNSGSESTAAANIEEPTSAQIGSERI